MLHLRVNGPDALLFGQPMILESVASGTLEKPPGRWAQHLKKLNYTVAKQGIVLKTHTLATLDEKEPKRELMGIRNKVEAALGYVVGDLAGQPCQRCERGLGPFPHCVRVPDYKYMTACVNCHWNADDVQCREFYIPLPGRNAENLHVTANPNARDMRDERVRRVQGPVWPSSSTSSLSSSTTPSSPDSSRVPNTMAKRKVLGGWGVGGSNRG